MLLRTVVRDCLFLNWALPAAELPPPPAPLRYERRRLDGCDVVFASALLFRQEGLHLPVLPLPRLSYPQFNLRTYVLDEDGVSSVLFWRILVPAWVVPGARLLGRQRAAPARFSYPQPSRQQDGTWSWRVEAGGALAVTARREAAAAGAGAPFASWQAMIDYFRQRRRGYVLGTTGLDRVEATHPAAAVWPLRAEVVDTGLLAASLPGGGPAAWPALHSAWLCPEIPLAFELLPAPEVSVPRHAPVPG